MHGVLYVCLPRSHARSSLQARTSIDGYGMTWGESGGMAEDGRRRQRGLRIV